MPLFTFFVILFIIRFNREGQKMAVKETGAYQEKFPLYCPTCNSPHKAVIEASQDSFAVLRCLKCDTALASGKFISFRAICPECGEMVIVT
jgi:Zn finger protein HypA/HybF involved in hydrogenase expression